MRMEINVGPLDSDVLPVRDWFEIGNEINEAVTEIFKRWSAKGDADIKVLDDEDNEVEPFIDRLTETNARMLSTFSESIQDKISEELKRALREINVV